MPPTHLVSSVLILSFCCLPGGIVALMHSLQVSRFWEQGDVQRAQSHSDAARMWVNLSVVATGLLWAGIVVLAVLGSAV
jgi:hypothetical protein